MNRIVLAGDVGGTRARFAMFDVASSASDVSAPRLVFQEVLESRSFRSFEAAFDAFVASASAAGKKKAKIAAATFGIAGPVVDQRVKTTNLPWSVDARAVSKTFGIPAVTLLNDLVAVGIGAMATPSRKLAVVHLGRPKRGAGNVAVIAAGTGLGEAVFVWDGQEHVACATEGSHVGFAPQDPVEDALLVKLRAELGGHVSYERIASGSTIAMLYRFMIEERGIREPKSTRAAVFDSDDPNVAVVELALAKESEAAISALELWAHVYGSEAGNLALKSLATGGVYVCGGVSAHLVALLTKGLRGKGPSPFVRGFLEKGRMRAVLEKVPVVVCLEPAAGLLGAVTHAVSRSHPPRGR